MGNDQKLLAEAYGGMVGTPVVRESHPSAERFALLRHKLEKLKFSRSEIVIDNVLDQVESLVDKALTAIGMEGPPPGKVTNVRPESVVEHWKRVSTPGHDVYDFLDFVKETYGQEILEDNLIMNEAMKKLQFEK